MTIAALWGVKILLAKCNSLTCALRQAHTNDKAQSQYTDADIGIGIILLVIGAILGIDGAKPKEREERTAY
jgi:hypothetical protein